MDDAVFKYRILPLQASSPITHLAFDDQPNCEFLTHLLLFVCPALPNLRKVTNFRQEHVEALCGWHGLDDDNWCPGEEEQERIDGVRNAFKRLAARITTWDVCINANDLRCIALANPRGIKSLTVRHYPLKSFKGEDQIGLLDALTPCTSLSELAIIHTSTEMTEEERENEDIVLFDEYTVKYKFPFALSLRSLAIRLDESPNHGSDYPYIFVKHFPNLVHLEMETDFRNLDNRQDFSPIHLPHLRHLEVSESNLFVTTEWTNSIYPLLILPSLTTLSIHRLDEQGSFAPADLSSINHQLETFYQSFPTLTDVYLTCPAMGVPKCYVDQFAPQTSIRFHTSWLPGIMEADYTGFELEEGIEEDLRGNRELMNETVYEIAEDLTSWMSNRLEGMKRLGDVEGTRELIRILKPAGEWRQWIED